MMFEISEPLQMHYWEIFYSGTKEEILKVSYLIIDHWKILVLEIFRNKKLIEPDIIEILTIPLKRYQEFFTRNIDIKDEYYMIVLHCAIKKRMKNVVCLMLQFKANLNAKDKRGNSIAHFFIQDEFGKSKITEDGGDNFLKFLISKEVKFDYKNEQGESALHLAISNYTSHVLPTLLKHTNDTDNQKLLELFLDQRFIMPVSDFSDDYDHFDIDSEYSRILKMLLDRGMTLAKANNGYDCSIISYAIKKKMRMVIIKELIGYYLKYCDDKDFATTMFHELINTCKLWNSVGTDYFLRVLSSLVDVGVNLNNEQVQKKLVSNAAKARSLLLLKFLKQNGVRFNFKFEHEESLLHLLAVNSDLVSSSNQLCDFISDLDFRGDCKVNATDDCGRTVLHAAAAYGTVSMVRSLIKLGAEINCRDVGLRMRTPLLIALSHYKNIEIVDLLLRNGADVNVQDSNGTTPLELAIWNDSALATRILIEYGASVNCKNDSLQTPLHRAVICEFNAGLIIELLLSNGADVNTKDQEGNSPLHLISESADRQLDSHKIMLKMLLKKGAYVNARNNQGESVLFRAILQKNTTMICELLKYNVDWNDDNVRKLLSKADDQVRRIFLQQWIKLKAADLTLDKECSIHPIDTADLVYYNECLAEIGVLKKTFISNDHSLFNFLHMCPENRCAYVNRKMLKKIIESPMLNFEFPKYSSVILAGYHKAELFETKRQVIIATSEIFELYDVSVPNVVEKIINYLDEEDLYVISATF